MYTIDPCASDFLLWFRSIYHVGRIALQDVFGVMHFKKAIWESFREFFAMSFVCSRRESCLYHTCFSS